ncbi:MAG: hypothetical protein DRH32_08595, partial [Deltaproteobacteria bacterium]
MLFFRNRGLQQISKPDHVRYDFFQNRRRNITTAAIPERAVNTVFVNLEIIVLSIPDLQRQYLLLFQV